MLLFLGGGWGRSRGVRGEWFMTKARKSLLTKGEHLRTRVYLQVLTAFKHTDRNRTENVILRLKIRLFLSR